MAHSSVDQAMVESMNQVAHALGKITVAECVENGETLQILKEMRVDRAQGNYIGRPDTMPVMIAQHTRTTDSLTLPQ
jgi:EAL domain-containing protein (putative c-di-GMP-specific phosphodiesterase class I)